MTDTQLQVSGGEVRKHSLYVQNMYNQYGAMLLGYILDVVKNRTVAEQYLVAVFKDLPYQVQEIARPQLNSFCYLQLIARKKLSSFFNSIDDCATVEKKQSGTINSNNKYIVLMSHEQQLVFCGVYWHGKTACILAAELGKTEDAIKKILKECFTTIRNSSK